MRISKRFYLAAVTMCLVLFSSGHVYAEELVPKSEEQLATEASEPTPASPEPTPAPPKLYPISINEEIKGEYKMITKTYALAESESPDYIDTSGFTKQGVRYELSDVLKKEQREENSIEHTEQIEVNTDNNSIDDIIAQLQPEMEYEKDGYAGVLKLDISTIHCEAAGYKTSSYEVNKTREYPHLSSNDTSLVPKTITEGGTTYTLADVNFKAQDTSLVDYESVPVSYTAVAKYTTTAKSTKVTGYVTTAQYKGTLAKTVVGKVIYSVVFISAEPVITPPPEATPEPAEPEPDISPGIELPDVFIPIALTLLTLLSVAGVSGLIVYILGLYNATVYNQDGFEFKKIERVKLKYKKAEPVIDLSASKNRSKYRSSVFVIELSEKATKDLMGRDITVRFDGKELVHKIPDDHDFRKYQFEVNFSDE